MTDSRVSSHLDRLLRGLAFLALFALVLFLGVLSVREFSTRVVGRSDPTLWREFFTFRTGVIWAGALFVGSLCAALLCGALVSRKASRTTSTYILLAFIGATLLSSVLIVIDSIVPGTVAAEVPLALVETAPLPAPISSNRGFSVYFRNGSSKIDDKPALESLLHAVSSCGAKEVQITGFVSSAPYASDNEENNVQLANTRAGNVSALASTDRLTPLVHNWQPTEFIAVVQGAGYMDKPRGSRAVEVEILNRRVDVSFHCSLVE